MAEVDFERRLERLFTTAPELSDSDAFADRVGRRLERGWTARRWLIGAAGGAGGIIAASQIVMSNVAERVISAGDSARALGVGLTQITPKAEWLTGVAAGGVTVWIAAALAIVTMGFALARVFQEL
jgi:hypothetical protein